MQYDDAKKVLDEVVKGSLRDVFYSPAVSPQIHTVGIYRIEPAKQEFLLGIKSIDEVPFTIRSRFAAEAKRVLGREIRIDEVSYEIRPLSSFATQKSR